MSKMSKSSFQQDPQKHIEMDKVAKTFRGIGYMSWKMGMVSFVCGKVIEDTELLISTPKKNLFYF